MPFLVTVLPITAVLFFGAIFGFFYAWICSTMWAFDLLDPRVAMDAMQRVNENVRNGVFFAGFMLTPVVGLLAAGGLFAARQKRAALWFVAATLVYFGGGLLLTAMVNVPMNEGLGALAIPDNRDEAAAIWNAYSPRWQFWNVTRALFSGVALALAALGLVAIRREGGRYPGDADRDCACISARSGLRWR